MINYHNMDFEKEETKKQLQMQKYFKRTILKYTEALADNSISTFKTELGNVS